MKFFVIEHNHHGIVGCELTKKKAIEAMQSRGYTKDEYTIEAQEVEVTSENIRRLLGNLGGYAVR